MRAIMISIKPKYCALEMNGVKSKEIRKNKALANAIKKLIDKNGYADIYVYCSKDKTNQLYYRNCTISKNTDKENWETITFKKEWFVPIATTRSNSRFNGKVLFKFRCYKVDDYVNGRKWSWEVGAPMWGACNDYEYILKDACLTDDELRNYADDLSFYAIHISDLEIFDKPKECREFYTTRLDKDIIKLFDNSIQLKNGTWVKPLTKAPQNFCYIEAE